MGIARDSGLDDNGILPFSISATAPGASAPLVANYSGNGTAGQNCATTPTNGGCPVLLTWSTQNTPYNGGGLTLKAVDGNVISGNPNHVPTTQTRTYIVQATDQFGNLTSDAGDPNPITLAATGNPDLYKCGSYSGSTPCTGATTAGSSTATDGSGVQTRTYSPVSASYNGLFNSTGGTVQERYNAFALNGTAGTQTDTATWKAPVTTFNTFFAATATNPAVATYATTATATKTAAVVFDFYVQSAQPVVTFATTPGNTVNTGTTVTVSATVKDQFGQPIKNANVQFIRSGNNDSSCTPTYPNGYGQQTNSDGKAGFSFTCNQAGTSNVSIIVSDNSGVELARGTQAVTFTGANTGQRGALTLSTHAINVGQAAVVTLTGTPGQAYTLYALTRPGTSYVAVRNGTFPSSGSVSYSIRPRGNTRLFVRTSGGDSATDAVSVRPAMSLAGSVAGKTVTFTGTIVPGHGNVAVRIFTVKNGTTTLVATGRTGSDGHYSIVHTFAGAGAVTFIAQTLSDGQNLSTQSNRITRTLT